MRRVAVFLLVLFVVILGLKLSAFARSQVFLGIGGGPFFSPGGAAFFHHRGSKLHFFFRLGHPGHPWGSRPWGYFSPPMVVTPYPNTPQRGFSGIDPSGALHINGYRVLPSGWLRLYVEPTDAEVLIDGFSVLVDRDSGTSGSLGFPVGRHQVEVRKPGFQPYQSEVEIKQAREVFLRIRMIK